MFIPVVQYNPLHDSVLFIVYIFAVINSGNRVLTTHSIWNISIRQYSPCWLYSGWCSSVVSHQICSCTFMSYWLSEYQCHQLYGSVRTEKFLYHGRWDYIFTCICLLVGWFVSFEVSSFFFFVMWEKIIFKKIVLKPYDQMYTNSNIVWQRAW